MRIWGQPISTGGGGASNAFTTIQPDSGTSPVADNSSDTLTVTGSNGLSTSGNSGTDTLTITGPNWFRTYFRPDLGNWNSMAFPLWQLHPVKASTITKVHVRVVGTGTTPTLKYNLNIRAASDQTTGTNVWSSDKQTAQASSVTEYTDMNTTSVSAKDVIWFTTPSSGALVSGTTVDYIWLTVEYTMS